MSNPVITDLIGTPFLDGGRDPKVGLDCWGLALEVFRRYGINNLPDYKISCLAAEQISAKLDAHRWAWVRCDPACLPVPALVVIRFNQVRFCNHTGVYLGAGRFIHTRQKIGANVDRIDGPVWRMKIEGFYIPRKGGGYEQPDYPGNSQ